MDIIHTRYIKSGIEDVFKAVSTENGIRGWWCLECSSEEKLHGVSKMNFHPGGKLFEMKFITEGLLENKLVLWKCIGNTNPQWLDTEVSFEMKPSVNSVELKFSHKKFPKGYDSKMENINWGKFMDSLKSYCETGTGNPMG